MEGMGANSGLFYERMLSRLRLSLVDSLTPQLIVRMSRNFAFNCLVT